MPRAAERSTIRPASRETYWTPDLNPCRGTTLVRDATSITFRSSRNVDALDDLDAHRHIYVDHVQLVEHPGEPGDRGDDLVSRLVHLPVKEVGQSAPRSAARSPGPGGPARRSAVQPRQASRAQDHGRSSVLLSGAVGHPSPTTPTVRACTRSTAWTRSSRPACGTTAAGSTRYLTGTACRSSGARRSGPSSTSRWAAATATRPRAGGSARVRSFRLRVGASGRTVISTR
jgi:hypothetical protein